MGWGGSRHDRRAELARPIGQEAVQFLPLDPVGGQARVPRRIRVRHEEYEGTVRIEVGSVEVVVIGDGWLGALRVLRLLALGAPLGESLPLDSRCVPVAALAEFLLVALAWLDGDPPSAFLTVEETRLCTRAAPSLVKSSSPRVTELSDESTNHDWLVSLDWLPTAEVELTRKHRTVPEAPHTDDSIARGLLAGVGGFLDCGGEGLALPVDPGLDGLGERRGVLHADDRGVGAAGRFSLVDEKALDARGAGQLGPFDLCRGDGRGFRHGARCFR